MAVITDDGVDLDAVPTERLESELCSLAAHIAAATARWLAWLAAYDRRRGWETWGCRSAAHWLNWRCAVSLPAAREKVRVAHALTGLPLIAASFERGELSYSKVRALCRVATVDNEPDLVGLAANMTASQLERLCGGLPPVDRNADHDAREAVRTRSFAGIHRGDGTMALAGRLPLDAGEAVMASIDAAVEVLISDATGPDLSRRAVVAHHGGLDALRADALVALVTGTLDAHVVQQPEVVVTVEQNPWPAQGAEPASSRERAPAEPDEPPEPAGPPRHHAPVEPDGSGRPTASGPPDDAATTGPPDGKVSARDAGLASWPDPAPAGDPGQPRRPAPEPPIPRIGRISGRVVADPVMRRLACDCRLAVVEIEQAGQVGHVTGVSASVRTPSPRLRRALQHRQGGTCCFPGCDASRRLHAHHVQHWIDGGPTTLDNLVLVCSFHHHLVHERGWSVSRIHGAITFVRPNGEPARIERLRGSVVGLLAASLRTDTDERDLAPPCYEPFRDASGVTATVIHNARLPRERAADQPPAA